MRKDEEGRSHDVDPEGDDRLLHQLNCLGLALARLYGRQEIGSEEIEKLWPVVFSSVPSERLKVLQALDDGLMTCEAVTDRTGLPRSTTYDALNVLRWAGLVEKNDKKHRLSEISRSVAAKWPLTWLLTAA